MNKEGLLSWKKKYDEEEDLLNNKGVEEELRKKFQENKFITKQDLVKIVKWKFQGSRLKGRQERTLKLLEPIKELFIEDVSKLAFKHEEDKTRLKLFSTIDGIGNALSSVILAFYDPQKYGVLDFHAWRGLFKEERKAFSLKEAIKFFNKLREISSDTGLSCRDIEKAIFKKDFDESKSGRRRN